MKIESKFRHFHFFRLAFKHKLGIKKNVDNGATSARARERRVNPLPPVHSLDASHRLAYRLPLDASHLSAREIRRGLRMKIESKFRHFHFFSCFEGVLIGSEGGGNEWGLNSVGIFLIIPDICLLFFGMSWRDRAEHCRA